MDCAVLVLLCCRTACLLWSKDLSHLKIRSSWIKGQDKLLVCLCALMHVNCLFSLSLSIFCSQLVLISHHSSPPVPNKPFSHRCQTHTQTHIHTYLFFSHGEVFPFSCIGFHDELRMFLSLMPNILALLNVNLKNIPRSVKFSSFINSLNK